MKLNGPVDSFSLFTNQIEHNQQGLWCVTLQPNGQVLALTEVELTTEALFYSSMRDLQQLLSNNRARQLLVVHISLHTPFFEELDWLLLAKVEHLLIQEECELCDYIKINKKRFSSLIQFDY